MNTKDNTALNERLRQRLLENAAIEAELTVTEAAYGEAVEALLPVAMSDTGASEAAANLLLSLYNSYNYHFPLVDLARLDLHLIRHALVAIRGRVMLGVEPHEVISNGTARFDALEAEWAGLHTQRRYNKDGR